MQRPRVLAIILAGGKGERLYPLTVERSKAAVSFAGKYRIIDFALSNFVNSEIYSIFVLVQYKAQSLIEHLSAGWRIGARIRQNFITAVPPQMRWGETWYRGTADAVYQNLNLIRDFEPDLVAVFGADHIYRMDVNQMIRFHLEREADVTVAALPVPLDQASGFGIIEADTQGRIVGFEEKPRLPRPMPDDPHRAFSSMGNYIFNSGILIETLVEDARRSTEHDFGKTIIPELFPDARVFAYNFLHNEVSGVRAYEEPGYWRDVGEIETYWKAHMDLLGPTPALDLHNPQWPILTENYDLPPFRILGGVVEDAMIGEGSLLMGAAVRRSIIGRDVTLEPDVVVEESIVMDRTRVEKGARLQRVIVDRYNTIRAGIEIGGPRSDPRYFVTDRSGIVVIPRGTTRRPT